MKLYDAEGNEVEAFTQAELDTKLAEVNKTAEEAKAALEAKTTDFDKLTKLHEDKSKSYTELMTKHKELESAETARRESIEKDYSKSIDEQVKKIAGDDKEYAKVLKEQLSRDGIREVTNEADKIAKQIKEAKALTDIALSREPSANPIDGGGAPPIGGDNKTPFTETPAGKDTLNAMRGMMNLPIEAKQE